METEELVEELGLLRQCIQHDSDKRAMAFLNEDALGEVVYQHIVDTNKARVYAIEQMLDVRS